MRSAPGRARPGRRRFCVAHDDELLAFLRAVPARPRNRSSCRPPERPAFLPPDLLRTGPSGTPRAERRSGRRWRRTWLSNENAKFRCRDDAHGNKSTVNSPASRIRPSASGTSCNGMGARPSPQSPASIRTDDVERPGLPWIVMTSVLCRGRSVENRPGMPSTWSKWPCVSKSRSSLLKPAPLRSNLALRTLPAVDHDAVAPGLH